MKYLLTACIVSATLSLSQVPVSATKSSTTPGNNGTVKIHEKGTPVGTENNDPKVCEFNVEGFGLDKGQGGTIVITTQGGGNDRATVKRLTLPAASATGYTESGYIKLASGHYKVTAYGKDTHGSTDYKTELKMKSKVIKVECPAPQPAKPVCATSRPDTPVNTSTTKPPQGHTSSTSTTTASTPRVVTAAATLPARTTYTGTIAATGMNPLQAIVNTALVGLGVYTSLLHRKRFLSK